jgi:hypothetical protein
LLMTGSIGRLGVAAGFALAAHLGMQGREGVHVCVGADRVLRHQAAGKCPAGTTEFYLAEAEGKIEGEPTSAEPGAKGEVAELRRQVAALRRQLADLQRSLAAPTDPIGARVVAPFVVVDLAGKPILSVRANPRSMMMSTATGDSVIFVSALETGGFFKARSKNASREAVVGVVGQYGAVEIRDGQGSKRAVLALQDDNQPILGLRNDKNVSAAALRVGGSGAGMLQLGDAAGNTTVDAGTTAQGVGLVRAYPVGSPGAGLVGMPGTFILGRR